MDVSLALLLISASVVMLAVSINDETTPPDHVAADQSAATLSSATMSATYSLAYLQDDSTWDTIADAESRSDEFNDVAFRRTVHGTVAELLADAAVTNTAIKDDSLTGLGRRYSEAVDAKGSNVFVGTNVSVYAVAIWRPYPDSSIEGRATIGDRPPRHADVSSVTLTVATDVPEVESGAVESGFASDSYEGAAEPIARSMVSGFFPPTEMQSALESQGFQRALAKYRYQRAATALDSAYGIDVTYPEAEGVLIGQATVLSRTGADAAVANDELQAGLTDAIATDLRNAYPSADSAQIAQNVSTNDVQIIVKTW